MAATRTQSASKPAVKKSATPEIKDQPVQVDSQVEKAISDLRAARVAKKAAERKESAAKAIIFEALPKHGKRKKLILMFGDKVLGNVSWRSRGGVDPDLLMQGWPEAYEACKTTSRFQQIG